MPRSYILLSVYDIIVQSLHIAPSETNRGSCIFSDLRHGLKFVYLKKVRENYSECFELC